MLSSRNRTLWPAELRTLEQRYSDAPPADLFVPTLPAFAAAKTAAWHDRRAPRDLWDLWALAEIDGIDHAAAELYRRYGPTNKLPGPHDFDRPRPIPLGVRNWPGKPDSTSVRQRPCGKSARHGRACRPPRTAANNE
ncbi:nucleotidyl transferase AbiEii/AbiGii toxin family protein [Nocardia farcinica]|uniref:nucleotidyl transferase AbiEii/AbiGii toxin family protein n=1 Tax=Nocardia farcinica TaxID=37329 RepID=UPI0027BA0146|nr:nucleotidyl transferase AbiEii/AbiGii toxin family protein [Nocardia farcinica]